MKIVWSDEAIVDYHQNIDLNTSQVYGSLK
jgi:hypothetical protein